MKMTNLHLICIVILGWGIGPLFYKIANDNLHPLVVSALVTTMFVLLIPPAMYVAKVDIAFNTVGVITALIGGFLMCIGSLAYFYALKGGDTGEVAAATSVSPAITLALAVIFLNEPLTFRKILGTTLALLGVLILSRK